MNQNEINGTTQQPTFQTFSFNGSPLRTFLVNGELLFIGNDATEILGYKNSSEALNDHCKLLKILNHSVLLGLGMQNPPARGLMVIPESDLYRLIIKSTKPEAEKFERWVMEEVLPTIRKTGGYSAAPKSEPAPQPDFDALLTGKSTVPFFKAMLLLAESREDHERRMTAVEHKTGFLYTNYLEGTSILEDMDYSDQRAAQLSNRAKTVKVITAFANYHTLPYQRVYAEFYREFTLRYHFNPLSRMKKLNAKSGLHVLEMFGLDAEGFALASELFRIDRSKGPDPDRYLLMGEFEPEEQ